jgi:hypothetical protein
MTTVAVPTSVHLAAAAATIASACALLRLPSVPPPS